MTLVALIAFLLLGYSAIVNGLLATTATTTRLIPADHYRSSSSRRHHGQRRQQKRSSFIRRRTTTTRCSTVGPSLDDDEKKNPNSSTSTSPSSSLTVAPAIRKGRPSTPGWTRKNKQIAAADGGGPGGLGRVARRRLGRLVRQPPPPPPLQPPPKSLDELTEWATADEPNRPIICEWEPDALWLWTQWEGTALSVTWIDVVLNIALGVAVDRWVHMHATSTWSFWVVPPASDPLVKELVGLKTFWEYQLTLCSFLLAFFTSQAYSYWRSVYFTTRALQGRINDVCMLLTLSAQRSNLTNTSQQQVTTGYDADARELVATCTRLLRLSHTFFWASTPTVSDGVSETVKSVRPTDAIGPLLLTPMGLEGLVEAKELTPEERKALMYCGLPPSQYPYVLLEWVGLYAMQGMRDGLLDGGFGLEDQLMKRFTDVRAEYFSIGDLTAGRMPLAYVQLVQILVDTVVWLAPVSLYSGLGALSIPLGALLTLFFKGQLEVCKSFLDPFGNEGHPAQNIRVDVLVSELNFGAASRWYHAAESLPIRRKQTYNGGKNEEEKNEKW